MYFSRSSAGHEPRISFSISITFATVFSASSAPLGVSVTVLWRAPLLSVVTLPSASSLRRAEFTVCFVSPEKAQISRSGQAPPSDLSV